MEKKKNAVQGLLTLVLLIGAVITIFPIYFLIVNSFKSQQEIVASPISLPKSWNLEYLMNAAEQISLFSSMLQTLLITVLAVCLIVVVSSLAAWAIARCKTKMANFLFLAYTAAMRLPFQSVMYPLVSLMDDLGLKNTYGLIIMYGGFGLSMSVLLYRGFIAGIPVALEEAAMLDGASITQIYRYVVMPLVKPTTMTVVITNAVWIWNDYLLPFLVIGNNSRKTLTLSLYYAKSLSGQYGNPWELIFPAVLLCVIPVIIIFIILQRNIIEGIAAGAVKG
ncbi:MAG: carbohydrate ABC transporter permease [Lachnospiraceae bacterium]|nr:carbohydrate ABC transporter permease [Lachnospiraceae bacterium]